jgi:uncharacterized membrane protein HdeD (DUF308 family)
MLHIKSANPNRIITRGIIAVVVGITLIVVPGLSLNLIIQILGGLLIIDGLINLVPAITKKDKQPNMFAILPRGTANLIFGLILIFFPQFIVGIFVFLIGFLLILAGGSQLASQIGGRNVLGFSLLITIISIIALIAGIVMLINPFKSASTMLIIFGVVLALYGAGEIIWSFNVRKYRKNIPPEQPAIVDVEYEEVE